MTLSLLFFACSEVTLRDDTQLNLDLNDVPVSLASPYLLGSSFDLRVVGNVSELPQYHLTVDDEDVLTVGKARFQAGTEDGDDDTLAFPALAAKAGTTTVHVTNNDGEEILTGEAVVAAPDAFELFAKTDLTIDEEPAANNAPIVFTEGKASFRVDFFAGGEPLAGAGGMAATMSGESIIDEEDSTFPDDENWLTLQPVESGEQTVTVFAGGQEAGQFTFSAVGEEGVAALDAHRESEDGADTGESLSVVVWGETAEGDRVYGVPFRWMEDGRPFEETGDQYIYAFDESTETTVLAQGAGRAMELTVHGVGQVTDTNSMACAVANVGPIGSAIALSLLGMAKRRRRA